MNKRPLKTLLLRFRRSFGGIYKTMKNKAYLALKLNQTAFERYINGIQIKVELKQIKHFVFDGEFGFGCLTF
jgi:hypothetical protein